MQLPFALPPAPVQTGPVQAVPFLPVQPASEPAARPTDTVAVPGMGSATVQIGLHTAEASAQPAEPSWNFPAKKFPGFRQAAGDKTKVYNFPAIIRDIPAIWDRPWSKDMRPDQTPAHSPKATGPKPGKETYGELFKRIGSEIGADPHALAAYCVFESYNSQKHSFNPAMQDVGGGMHASGIAATQAQDWKGRKIPGLETRFPTSIKATAALLAKRPDYALRCLAEEFKKAYASTGQNLAKTFPKVAYPSWGNPSRVRGNYGTQAQYVSRAHALYQAFKAADKPATPSH